MLKARTQSPRPQVPAAMLSDDLPARRLDVLLAEDNPVNQRLAATVLQRRGHRVTIVGDGTEALAAIEARRYDVVLMDVQMPKMSGLEVTAAVRRREAESGGRHLPIVAMTAHALKGDRERCLAEGMDEYLTKPLNPKRLCMIVEEIAEGLSHAEAFTAEPESIDVDDAVLARVGGDLELLADISRLFIEDMPLHLRRMRSAIDQQNGEALVRAAHGFKGAAANFGASAAVDTARQLEDAGRHGDFDEAERAWRILASVSDRLLHTLRAYIDRARSEQSGTKGTAVA